MNEDMQTEDRLAEISELLSEISDNITIIVGMTVVACGIVVLSALGMAIGRIFT